MKEAFFCACFIAFMQIIPTEVALFLAGVVLGGTFMCLRMFKVTYDREMTKDEFGSLCAKLLSRRSSRR